jgi:hypothetical protein
VSANLGPWLRVGGGGSTGRSAKVISFWIIQVSPAMASTVAVARRLFLGQSPVLGFRTM